MLNHVFSTCAICQNMFHFLQNGIGNDQATVLISIPNFDGVEPSTLYIGLIDKISRGNYGNSAGYSFQKSIAKAPPKLEDR